MNCKPGELAVIVMCPRGTEHLRGKIIRLKTLANPRQEQPKNYGGSDYSARWNYEGPRMFTSLGTTVAFVNDCCLRPLRGGPMEEDETPRQLELLDA